MGKKGQASSFSFTILILNEGVYYPEPLQKTASMPCLALLFFHLFLYLPTQPTIYNGEISTWLLGFYVFVHLQRLLA